MNATYYIDGAVIEPAVKLDGNAAWLDDDLEFINRWRSGTDTYTINTSGSTGHPKSIVVSRSDLKRSARYTIDALDLKKGMSALLCLPIKFIGGKMMVIRAEEIGLNLYLSEPSTNPLLDTTDAFDFIAITPFQLHHILKDDQTRGKLNVCKKVIVGGGTINYNDIQSIDEKAHIYSTYGMTETLSHIALARISAHSKDLTYELISEDFSIETDERSCLNIQSPYDHMPMVTTNDVCEITNRRQFKIKGRIDNVINSGGLKLYPEEIEQILSAVIPVPFYVKGEDSIEFGSQAVLHLETTNDGDFTKEWLESELKPLFEQSAQCPKRIQLHERFSYTENGKIIR